MKFTHFLLLMIFVCAMSLLPEFGKHVNLLTAMSLIAMSISNRIGWDAKKTVVACIALIFTAVIGHSDLGFSIATFVTFLIARILSTSGSK